MIDKWNEATKSAGFVKLETDVEKDIVITEWELIEHPKDAENKMIAGKWEFKAKVLEEDGNESEDVIFSTVSKRLLQKLKLILQEKKPSIFVRLGITKVGEKFSTQYVVREIKLDD